MKRLLSAARNDFVAQCRYKLYAIGIVVAVIIALGMWRLATAEQMAVVAPAMMLIIVGGSTLFYVAGMMLFERAEGAMSAIIVSPLRASEYLGAKVATLTMLASLESAIMIALALLLERGWGAAFSGLSLPMLTIGIVCMGIIYTLTGIVLAVRYRKITDALIPLALAASLYQLPALYYLGVFEHHWILAIPTSGPAELVRGAFVGLGAREWSYGLGYSAIAMGVGAVWSKRAFSKHIISKGG